MSTQPITAPSRAGSLALVGGILALDFCNTSSGRGTERHIEHLLSVSDLLTWARHASIVDEATDARLRARCDADKGLAARFLERALELREAVHQLATDFARDQTVDQDTVDRIARAHVACLEKGRLLTSQGAFGWSWRVEDAPEETVLGPIAASAMAMIGDADRARLKRCEGHNCGWLFLDTTKSNNRVWCEMEPCGNRAKQTRRRRRTRAAP